MRAETPQQRTVPVAEAKSNGKPAGAPTSVFDMAKTPAAKPKRATRAFDIAAVAIEANVLIPPKIGGRGGVSMYALLAKRIKPGQVAWLDEKRAYGLKVWFRKNGKRAEVRKLADGRVGCWLLDAAPPPKGKATGGKP